jgi:signal transduction histidine kinase
MGAAASRFSHHSRLALLAMWPAVFGFGLLSLLIAQSHPGATFGGTSWAAGLAGLAAGWAVIGAGFYVSWRRGKRAGLLLAAAGVAWFFPEWDNPGLGAAAFTFGLVTYALAPAVVAHAVMAYPPGRLSSRAARLAVMVAYADAALILGLLPALFFNPPEQGCSLCPPNLLLADARPGLFESLNRWGIRVGLVWTIAIAALIVWRLAQAAPPLRRAAAPVLVAGTAYLLLAWSDFAHSLPRGMLGTDQFEYRLWLAQAAALCVIGLGVAWSWLLGRRARAAMAALVVEMGESPPPAALRDVLARSLGDPDLEVAYPLADPGRLVDATGTAVDPAKPDGRTLTPLARQGQTAAVLFHRPGLLDDPAIVEEVAAAARLALDNERLQAEVLAQLEELRASRARIVTTGDAERQRLERDLHDGAQQRLVGLALALRLARAQPGTGADPNLIALLDQADERLSAAIGELRELAHGIYPAALTEEGLAAAVEALGEHTPTPVTVIHMPQRRFPGPVEAAAYFVIAETTGYLATLDAASGMTVDVRHDGGRLVIEVTEDAAGHHPGPELDARFTGLADRVGALNGQLRVGQAATGGITIGAELPCGS